VIPRQGPDRVPGSSSSSRSGASHRVLPMARPSPTVAVGTASSMAERASAASSRSGSGIRLPSAGVHSGGLPRWIEHGGPGSPVNLDPVLGDRAEQVQQRLVLTPPGPPPRAPTTNPDRRYPLGSTSWFERGRHGHDSDSPAPRHPLLPRSVFANVQQGDTVGDVAGGEQRRYSRYAPVHPVKSAGWAAHEVDRRRR